MTTVATQRKYYLVDNNPAFVRVEVVFQVPSCFEDCYEERQRAELPGSWIADPDWTHYWKQFMPLIERK